MGNKHETDSVANRYSLIGNTCSLIVVGIVLFIAASYDFFGIMYPFPAVIAASSFCFILLGISWHCWRKEEKLRPAIYSIEDEEENAIAESENIAE